jgi:hypothetical protein
MEGHLRRVSDDAQAIRHRGLCGRDCIARRGSRRGVCGSEHGLRARDHLRLRDDDDRVTDGPRGGRSGHLEHRRVCPGGWSSLCAGAVPEGKVVLCDLKNLTTGSEFEALPFLVAGAP